MTNPGPEILFATSALAKQGLQKLKKRVNVGEPGRTRKDIDQGRIQIFNSFNWGTLGLFEGGREFGNGARVPTSA